MLRLLSLLIFFYAQTSQPAFFSPLAGETLRGQVEIRGEVNLPGFSSAELAFAYAAAPDAWFIIRALSALPSDSTLAVWDTTLLTDGDYVLHLRVYFQDGSSQDALVSDLKIRNDVIPAIVTDSTPQAESSPTLAATETPRLPATPTPAFSTLTPLLPNPASVTPPQIFNSLARGGFFAVLAILTFALILRLRKR